MLLNVNTAKLSVFAFGHLLRMADCYDFFPESKRGTIKTTKQGMQYVGEDDDGGGITRVKQYIINIDMKNQPARSTI